MPVLLALLLAATPVHPAEEIVPRAVTAEDAPVPVRFGWKPGLVLAIEVLCVRTERDGAGERVASRRFTYELRVAKVGDGLEVRAGSVRVLDPAPAGGVAVPDLPPFGLPPVRLTLDGGYAGMDPVPLGPVVRADLADASARDAAMAAARIEAELRREYDLLVGRWTNGRWVLDEPVETRHESPAIAGTPIVRETRRVLAGRVPCAPGGAARCVRFVHRERTGDARAFSRKGLDPAAGRDAPSSLPGEPEEISSALVTDPDTLIPVEVEERRVQVFGRVGPARVEVIDLVRMTFRRR